jgi:hypothetical protein
MKHAVATLLMAATFVAATEIDSGAPEPKDLVDDLYDIIEQMDNMTGQLRDDECHDGVQLRGKEIEERLTKLIDEIEKQKPKFENPGRDQQALAATGRQPKKISQLSSPLAGSCIVRRSETVQREADTSWYKLPPSKRGQVVQAWGSDMPMQWKSRLGAYFLSLAVQESEFEKKAQAELLKSK